VRYFFRRRVPPIQRVLLVESGSRSIAETVLPRMLNVFGSQVSVDLVTCYPGIPAGFPPDTRVFRVSDYQGRAARGRLYRELRAIGYDAAGIVCSAEPIMKKWKWALGARVPAKLFVINENADFFWFDYDRRGVIAHFALLRSGLGGAGAVRTAARLAAFPFALVFLLAYAAAVHSRRALRLIAARRTAPLPH
jgi:hypothetical protein